MSAECGNSQTIMQAVQRDQNLCQKLECITLDGFVLMATSVAMLLAASWL